MQAFLNVAEAMRKKDVLLKVWAEQVRDVSYAIEDCLAEFMVHVQSQSLSRRLLKLKDRHRIAIQIRDLKSRVEEVSTRNTRYNLIKTMASSTADEMDTHMEDVRNHSANSIDEAGLVGFDKTKEELIEMVDVNITDGSAKVICVVGMGGLGKTTLARKVYESKKDIVKMFSCCAWITVSLSFSKIEMLKDIIKQLLGDVLLKKCLTELEEKVMHTQDLAKFLGTMLENKRYVIVLDDLWTIDAWKWISDLSFYTSDKKASRIIVTTRDVGLAKQITLEDSLIYHLKPLESVDATNLLLRKSSITHENMETDEKFKSLVEQLVKKCGYLPLALLTIGGILANKKVNEWENFYNQLPSELETNPSLEAMRRLVTLSYNHLPSHLKSCYLYLSIFPEDFEIKRRHLIERWIAEGFISTRGGVNIMDVGKSYFNELINRSMIQPSKVGIEGSVKSCRVHDIMRDVMVSISRDENFVCLTGDNVTGATEENFYHISYHSSKCQNIDIDRTHVRSLTMFGEKPMESSHPVCLVDFKMLRALDLEDANLRKPKEDISNIGLLLHLKYVNVRAACGAPNLPSNYKLPRSIGKLQGLQILHARGICSATLPTGISKLRSLRSLRCTRDNRVYQYVIGHKNFFTHASSLHLISPTNIHYELGGVVIPRGMGNLKDLQILEVVDIGRTSSKAIKELGELTQLRKLAVVTGGASEQKYKILREAIEKLSSLSSLTVNGTRLDCRGNRTGEGFKWLHSVSSPPPFLRSLELRGCLEDMPGWVSSLIHLVKLKLQWSQLNEESKSMEILGTLPNLMLLHLHSRSYVGEKLVFGGEAFPKLRNLGIDGLDQLREVRFEESNSPQMEKIQISGCGLQSGIVGIKNLPRLNELSLGDEGRVARFGELQDEVDTHTNHPLLRLRLWKERSYHDLQLAAAEGSSSLPTDPASESSDVHAPPNNNRDPAPESAESSDVPTTTSNRSLSSPAAMTRDDLLYTYNSC